MKIAILQDWLRLGGTEKHTVYLANAISEAKHDVCVLSCRPRGELASGLNARHRVLQPFDTRINVWAPGLIKALRQEKPDVVLLMGSVANACGAQIKSALEGALVVGTLRTGNALGRRYLNSLKHVDCVIANSEWARAHGVSEGVDPGRVVCIRNAFHRKWVWEGMSELRSSVRSENMAGESKVFICVAGFRPGKGQLELIETLSGYKSEKPWKLWLLGTGAELARCRTRAVQLGMSDRVRFLGSVDDPQGYYAAADICLFASQAESLPNAVIEAQWCGLPVVAYDVGGIKECMDPGKSGFVVPMNDKAAFRARLGELHASDELCEGQAKAAREFADANYAARDVAGEYLATFEERGW